MKEIRRLREFSEKQNSQKKKHNTVDHKIMPILATGLKTEANK
jgi:hypothetical protein